MTSCQQQRLINFRNLTLVEGEAPQEHSEKESEFVKVDPEEVASNDTDSEIVWESDSYTEPSTNLEVEETNPFEQVSYTDDYNNDTPTVIENDFVLSPRTVQDSTKTDNKEVSKKDAKKIMGVAGGITLLALLFFIFLGLLGLLFIALIIWAFVSAFVL